MAGLFDSGTTFGNNALYLTLPTAQTVAELPGELSSMIVTVDSMENLEAAKTALESALGTDKADVTQGQNLESAVSSLGSFKIISFIAFVAALGTAGLMRGVMSIAIRSAVGSLSPRNPGPRWCGLPWGQEPYGRLSSAANRNRGGKRLCRAPRRRCRPSNLDAQHQN